MHVLTVNLLARSNTYLFLKMHVLTTPQVCSKQEIFIILNDLAHLEKYIYIYTHYSRRKFAVFKLFGGERHQIENLPQPRRNLSRSRKVVTFSFPSSTIYV